MTRDWALGNRQSNHLIAHCLLPHRPLSIVIPHLRRAMARLEELRET
jgi:hypothetical protein